MRTFPHHTQWPIALIASLLLANFSYANTELWQGVSGTSVSTNWSDNLNWLNLTGTGGPGPNGNDTLFGDTGAVGAAGQINSVVDNASLNPFSLTFTNQSQNSMFHTVLIPNGVGMTNANGLTVGGRAVDGYVTTVNIVGGGILVQNGSSTIVKNTGANSQTEKATLDLSGLSNFVVNASSGTMVVAGNGSDARGGGVLNLAAASNNITVGTISFNTGSGNNSSVQSFIQLGYGTNIINVGTFTVVGTKASNGKVQFLPGAPTTAGLRLRGVNGNSDDTSRATLTLGDRNNTGSGNTDGELLLNGNPVDLKVGTLTIGQDRSGSTSATHGGIGVVQYDLGVLDANSIVMAACTTGDPGAPAATGTLSVGANARLLVGGPISMANQAHGTATGTLNINGGSALVYGNISKATVAGTASINMTGGSLNLAGLTNAIGTPAIPIDNMSLQNSTLTLPVAAGTPGAVVVNLTISGASDTINIASVPGTASFPAQFPVIAYTGLSGAYDFVLGSLPGTYQGYLSNNVATSTVDLVLTNSQVKTDTWRGNVSGSWDTGSQNWVYLGNPVSYLQGDFVTFDDTLTGTPNVVLATNMTPGAIAFNNATHNYVLSGAYKLTGLASLTKQGTGTVTLSESGGDDFLGGIVVDAGTLILDNANSAISGGLTINGGTAQIGNGDTSGSLPAGNITDDGALVFNRTDNVSVAAAIGGSGTLTQGGTGTLTLTRANTYSGNTFVNSGTLALTGAGTISNSAIVTIHNATLDTTPMAQSLFAGLTLDGATVNVAVNANGAPPMTTGSLAFGVGANHLNVASLPPIATYPVTFTIVQSAAPATGSFNVALGGLPAATPPYAGNVSQSTDQSAVLLTLTSGPVGVRQTVFWTGSDLANSTNWSDKLNWQLPGEPGAGENVSFTSTAAQSTSALSGPGGGAAALVPDSFDNLVDGNVAIASLTYSNLANSFHNTALNTGRTLTLTNGLSVGTLDTGGSADKTSATVSGTNATLAIDNGNMQVWLGSGSVGGSQATLDLSALDNLNASVSRLLVGATIGNIVNRPSGVLYLAKTNTISAGFQTTTSEAGTTTANAGVVVGDCNGNAGSESFLYLGQVNTIFADTIAFARQKTKAQVAFNPIYANVAPYPTVTFQGFSSSRVSFFDVADAAGNTGTTTGAGDLNLLGGIVTASVDTLNIGRASSGSGSGTTTGTAEFNAGTITANTCNVGLQPSTGTKVGIGTLSVESNAVIGAAAKLVVNGLLNLGGTPAGTVGSSTSGTLAITNGTVWAYSIAPGAGSHSSIILAGGQLIVTNAIGSASTPLETLTLSPLGTPDNLANSLRLPVGTSGPALTVTTLNLDALDTTTNVIGIESVGPVGNLPVELPLIQYGTMNFLSGATFNIGLGTLPAGYSGYLTNDTASSSIALVLTGAVNPQPMPIFSSITRTSPTTITFSGANGFANRSFTLLTSNDVTLPLSSWTVLGTGVYAPDGSFSFSTSVNPAASAQFFRVQTQ